MKTKQKNNLTTYAGIAAAVCASVLGTGLIETGTPVFIAVSVVGAVALGLLGYFSKDKEKTNG